LVSLRQAAERLGLDPAVLSRAARAHPLYAPDVRGVPTGQETTIPLGKRIVRYHVDHVRIIERVLMRLVDLETGWLEWQVERGRMGESAERRVQPATARPVAAPGRAECRTNSQRAMR
jgi:hypothetical protein